MSKHPKAPSMKWLPVAFALVFLPLAGCGSPEQRAQGYFERGKTYFEQGEIPKARVELRNALQIKSDMVDAWRILVQIEEKAKNWDAVVANSRRIVELDPKDVEARVRLGKVALANNSTEEAMRLANAAVEIDPRNVSALTLRASVLLKLDDAVGAVQEAHKALGIDPANLDAVIVLAAERFRRDDLRGALRFLDDLPDARKDDLAALLLKTKIYEKMKDLPQIEAHLRKIIQARPNDQVFKNELLKFYVANNRLDDAERELRAMAAAVPSNVQAGMDVVRFVQQTRGVQAARDELVSRAKGPGPVVPFQIALAQFDFQQGKFEDSKQTLERIISSDVSSDDKISARTALAEMYINKKDFAAAEKIVTDILQADGRNTSGLRLRATIRIERGQLDDAITDLRQALNDQPRSSELLLLMAAAFERNGSIELADKQLADAMRASNFAPNIGLSYVSFLQRRGLGAHAETVLTDLASRNPTNTAILSALAQAKLRRQDWAGAHEIAETMRRMGTAGSLPDQISGAAYGGEGKLDQSLAAWQNVQTANPESAPPMLAMVRTYLQAKQPEKAEIFLDSVLKANPKNAEAHVLMGMTKLARNAPDQALKSYKTAIEHQPANPIGYSALSDYYLRQKNVDAALQTLRDGLKAAPTNFTLRLAAANILETKGDTEGAISEYETLLKSQPESLVVINNLASLLSETRTDKESRDRAYTLALALTRSQIPQFKDTLGWIQHLRGDNRAAVILLEEAANALPNRPAVLYHLGMTYAALGEKEKAAEWFKKALALATNEGDLKSKIETALKQAS